MERRLEESGMHQPRSGPSFVFKQLYSAFISWLHRVVACKTSVTHPRIEPILLALGARSLNHWTAREVLKWSLNVMLSCLGFWNPPTPHPREPDILSALT